METKNLLFLAVVSCFSFALLPPTPIFASQTLTMFDQVHSIGLSKTVPGQLSYQGLLADATDSSAVTATLEMTFRIFDSETGGAELWNETHPAVQVAVGLFQVLLGIITSFPADLFDGPQLWLQTEVGTEILAPRKPLVSVAYSRRAEEADHAATADWAMNAQNAVCADSADYVPGASAWTIVGDNIYRETGKVGIGTTDPLTELDVAGSVNATTYYGDGSHLTGISGTTDNDWTIVGSDIYHQTGNVGIGTTSPAHPLDVHGVVNTDSVYGIDGSCALSAKGTGNIFVGIGAGENSEGGCLTFMGQDAGRNNQGSWNTFYGCQAGSSNTTGCWNTFVGMFSGNSNTEGNWNTFVGMSAGGSNTTGDRNTYFGLGAGELNATGDNNTFVGLGAGGQNVDGSGNVFIGHRAGQYETGSNKLYIANGLDPSNLLIYGDFATGKVGIGTNNPLQALDVDGAVNATTYYGDGSHLTGISGTTDNDWTIDGDNIYHQTGNVGIGTTSPATKLHVTYDNTNSLISAITIDNLTASVGQDVLSFNFSGLPQARIRKAQGGSLFLETNHNADLRIVTNNNVRLAVTGSGDVGIGTISPTAKLDVNGHINANSVYEIGGAPVLSGSSFSQNIQVGHGAGSNNTASGVTLVGYNAGKENEGDNTTSVGWSAGYQSTGYGNTFIGASAGHDNVTGERNTFVGHYAGQFNYSGSNNTFVGEEAGYDNINGSDNVFIGHQAGRHEYGSNKLYVANGPDTSDVIIYGDFSNGRIGLGTANPTSHLHLESASPMITLNTTAGNYAGMYLRESGSAKWTVAYSPGDNYLFFYDSSTKAGTRMVLQDGTGNVGIGTASPDQKLTVAGAVRTYLTSGPHLIIHDSNGGSDRPGLQFTNNSIHYIGGDDGSDEYFGFYSQYALNRTYDAHLRVHGKATSNWGRYIDVTHDGSDGIISTDAGDIILSPAVNVGIGTSTPAYKLDVNGDINIAGSYNIKKAGLNYMHPDYVFEPDYDLMPLDELREYVSVNKSLPNVISAEDVKNNEGFKMDELLVQILEKIEEQTLYIFQLEERISKLEGDRR